MDDGINDNVDNDDPDSTSNYNDNDDVIKIAVANRAYEFEPLGSNNDAGVT